MAETLALDVQTRLRRLGPMGLDAYDPRLRGAPEELVVSPEGMYSPRRTIWHYEWPPAVFLQNLDELHRAEKLRTTL